MSNSVLVLGESGSGKSSSIRNLDFKETFIINIISKPLPFRGYKRFYNEENKNYLESDNYGDILKYLKAINERREDIKNIIIDDFGYAITNSFMRKANQNGYQKYTDLGLEVFTILDVITKLREDIFCFVMMHTDIDQQGRYKPKTAGKMIDQHICIEGKFTYVYHALVNEGKYQFLTNNDGQHMAKTPMDMHEDLFIDNDLSLIIERIKEYDN